MRRDIHSNLAQLFGLHKLGCGKGKKEEGFTSTESGNTWV